MNPFRVLCVELAILSVFAALAIGVLVITGSAALAATVVLSVGKATNSVLVACARIDPSAGLETAGDYRPVRPQVSRISVPWFLIVARNRTGFPVTGLARRQRHVGDTKSRLGQRQCPGDRERHRTARTYVVDVILGNRITDLDQILLARLEHRWVRAGARVEELRTGRSDHSYHGDLAPEQAALAVLNRSPINRDGQRPGRRRNERPPGRAGDLVVQGRGITIQRALVGIHWLAGCQLSIHSLREWKRANLAGIGHVIIRQITCRCGDVHRTLAIVDACIVEADHRLREKDDDQNTGRWSDGHRPGLRIVSGNRAIQYLTGGGVKDRHALPGGRECISTQWPIDLSPGDDRCRGEPGRLVPPGRVNGSA